MKTTANPLPLIVLLVVTMQCHGVAQQASNFASLPLKDAKAAINRPESKGDLPQMAAEALASRRLDLIKLFFEIQYSSGYIYRALRDTKDKAFQARVVLMMLRSKSGFWPPDEYETGFFPKRPLDEPIKGVLKDYLPNEKLDANTVATEVSRVAVAEKLATALEKANITKPEDGQAPATPPNMARPPARPASQPNNEPEAKPVTTQGKEPSSSTPWGLVVILIVAASGLLWLLLKKRR